MVANTNVKHKDMDQTTEQQDIETAAEWHVCGLVIQGKVEKISDISTALLAIPNTEIHGVEVDKGKIVVVMQSHHQRILLENMEAARNIDGVVAVSLVYHQQDQAE